MIIKSAETGRHRQRAGVRPAALAALTLALAYGGGLWLHLLHEAQGASETGAPIGVLHWLRDSTLLLPIVFVTVWASLVLGRRFMPHSSDGRPRLLRIAALAATVAAITSLAEALASPLHTIAFGAHHDHHGVEMPLAVHMAYDGIAALAANLAIAALVLIALRGQVWAAAPRQRPARRWFESAPLRRVFALAAGITLLATSGLLPRVDTATVRSADPVGPCPAGAPMKAFDVSAIDVVMMLNRFGDHDPQAQMFVLDSKIQAVRDQEAAGRTAWI